jgi:hypothetical protein
MAPIRRNKSKTVSSTQEDPFKLVSIDLVLLFGEGTECDPTQPVLRALGMP